MSDQTPLPRPPRRADYEPIVKAMRPWVGDEELTIRSSLLLLRDRATATKSIACEPSWMLLDVVERIAADNALNNALPVDVLRELRRLCVMCVANASGFDAVFQPRLPGIDQGEAAS